MYLTLIAFRSPFQGDKDYVDTKTQLLQLGFEMATSAHRDIFSDQPNRTIRNICNTLAKMADHIIQVPILFTIYLYNYNCLWLFF